MKLAQDERKTLLINLTVLATVILVIWFFGIHPTYSKYPILPIPEWLLITLFFVAGSLGVIWALQITRKEKMGDKTQNE